MFHTQGCHLCEIAEALVVPAAARHGWIVSRIDIAGSDALIERYGTRIPVLRVNATDAELGWPFTAEDLDAFLGG